MPWIVFSKGRKLKIKLLDTKKLEKNDECIVFDANRDNKGKGIEARKLAKALRKTV